MDFLKSWIFRWGFFLIYMAAVSVTVFILIQDHESWHHLMDGAIPRSGYAIFLHNAPIVLLFGMPFLGFPLDFFSLGTSALIIGISYHTQGILRTLSLLWHLPLELFALVGLMKCRTHRWFKRLALCMILLLISAFIEVRLI